MKQHLEGKSVILIYQINRPESVQVVQNSLALKNDSLNSILKIHQGINQRM